MIRESRIRRIVNLLTFGFSFEHAHRPAALVISGEGREGEHSYKFDYWTPKAVLNFRLKGAITLSSSINYR